MTPRIGLDTAEFPRVRPVEADVRIGLEVHVYVRTAAKLFCGCSAQPQAAPGPNTQVCPVCTAQPGAKPMPPNAAALEAGVRLARALGMTLAPRFRFLRKHYFYPDSPANHQRTGEPLATGGALLGVALRELHVEEDPGAYDADAGLVAYDRAGLPLLELVTEPDVRDPAHARALLEELRLVLGYLGVLRGEAGLKADCNLSLPGGERVEVKNVNSARNVERALAFEARRQAEVLARGERVARETRGFDEATGTTTRLREKESEADYRYLEDPDLLPVDVAALAASLPKEEAPLARRARLAATLGMPEADAWPLVEERGLADAFELAAARAGPRPAHDFLVRDVRGELAARGKRLDETPLRPAQVARLVEAQAKGQVTPQVAKRLLRDALDGADLDEALAREAALGAPEDDLVRDAARATLAANPRAVADVRAGKQNALHFLVGQTTRALKGRAPPDAVRRAVEDALRATSGDP